MRRCAMSGDGEKPIVTTVITSYNHRAYIRDAVDSALRQNVPFRHEILLSDDGSTDGTADVMAEYAAKHPGVVRDVSTKTNRGISANMRDCLGAARGEYVAILEGDDYYAPSEENCYFFENGWEERITAAAEEPFADYIRRCPPQG